MAVKGKWDFDNPAQRATGESDKALGAFLDFVDLGPGRSLLLLGDGYNYLLKKTHPQYGFFKSRYYNKHKAPPTKSHGTLKGWSGKYEWQARMARITEIRTAERAAIRDARREELEEANWQDGLELRRKCMEFVTAMDEFKKTVAKTVETEDGEKQTLIYVELNTTVAQLAQALKTAEELQRHAINERDQPPDLRGGSLLSSLIHELDGLIAGGKGGTAGETDDAGTA